MHKPSAPAESIRVLKSNEARVMRFPWGELTWWADAENGNSDALTVGRCVLEPGSSNPRHYHPNCSEILVVLEGTIEHTLSEKESVLMQPGDTVTIPCNLWHNARNVGAGRAVLLITFSSATRQTIGE